MVLFTKLFAALGVVAGMTGGYFSGIKVRRNAAAALNGTTLEERTFPHHPMIEISYRAGMNAVHSAVDAAGELIDRLNAGAIEDAHILTLPMDILGGTLEAIVNNTVHALFNISMLTEAGIINDATPSCITNVPIVIFVSNDLHPNFTLHYSDAPEGLPQWTLSIFTGVARDIYLKRKNNNGYLKVSECSDKVSYKYADSKTIKHVWEVKMTDPTHDLLRHEHIGDPGKMRSMGNCREDDSVPSVEWWPENSLRVTINGKVNKYLCHQKATMLGEKNSHTEWIQESEKTADAILPICFMPKASEKKAYRKFMKIGVMLRGINPYPPKCQTEEKSNDHASDGLSSNHSTKARLEQQFKVFKTDARNFLNSPIAENLRFHKLLKYVLIALFEQLFIVYGLPRLRAFKAQFLHFMDEDNAREQVDFSIRVANYIQRWIIIFIELLNYVYTIPGQFEYEFDHFQPEQEPELVGAEEYEDDDTTLTAEQFAPPIDIPDALFLPVVCMKPFILPILALLTIKPAWFTSVRVWCDCFKEAADIRAAFVANVLAGVKAHMLRDWLQIKAKAREAIAAIAAIADRFPYAKRLYDAARNLKPMITKRATAAPEPADPAVPDFNVASAASSSDSEAIYTDSESDGESWTELDGTDAPAI